jgi:hypothetical protein
MERSAELEQFVSDFYDSLKSGAVDRLDAAVSQEVLGIGTDPDEWWEGETFTKTWKAQMEAMGGTMPIAPGSLVAYREGNVGWFADRPAFDLPGGQVPFRLTGVAVKEGDDWKIVQVHASIGIPNAESVGVELPT